MESFTTLMSPLDDTDRLENYNNKKHNFIKGIIVPLNPTEIKVFFNLPLIRVRIIYCKTIYIETYLVK